MPKVLINFDFPQEHVNVLKKKYGDFDFAVSTDKKEVLNMGRGKTVNELDLINAPG